MSLSSPCSAGLIPRRSRAPSRRSPHSIAPSKPLPPPSLPHAPSPASSKSARATPEKSPLPRPLPSSVSPPRPRAPPAPSRNRPPPPTTGRPHAQAIHFRPSHRRRSRGSRTPNPRPINPLNQPPRSSTATRIRSSAPPDRSALSLFMRTRCETPRVSDSNHARFIPRRYLPHSSHPAPRRIIQISAALRFQFRSRRVRPIDVLKEHP